MIAIVDHHVERRVVVRTATAAGLIGGLMQGHLDARRAQASGRGKAGQSSPDDMDRCDHQNT